MGRARVVGVPHEIVDLVRVHRAVDNRGEVPPGLLRPARGEEGRAAGRGAADESRDGLRGHPVILGTSGNSARSSPLTLSSSPVMILWVRSMWSTASSRLRTCSRVWENGPWPTPWGGPAASRG